MSATLGLALDNITNVRGVRGALLVSSEDGLIVAESLMESVRGNAVAALAASVVTRFIKASAAAGVGQPQFLHLHAVQGAVFTVPAGEGVLVVAVTDPEVNVGLVRLEMLRAAEVVS